MQYWKKKILLLYIIHCRVIDVRWMNRLVLTRVISDYCAKVLVFIWLDSLWFSRARCERRTALLWIIFFSVESFLLLLNNDLLFSIPLFFWRSEVSFSKWLFLDWIRCWKKYLLFSAVTFKTRYNQRHIIFTLCIKLCLPHIHWTLK